MSASAPSSTGTKISNSERKDRSIRLWGERGQLALEQGHVCVLRATVLATEVLKNLVLPGVGTFTIVDNARVTERDLGNNFFVTQASIGEPRCREVTRLLLELNDEVKGNFVDEDPATKIEEDPDFFGRFSAVIATDLAEPLLLKLAAILWGKNIPLFVGKAYGMIGAWRNVLPEVCIVESRPEYSKENYRLDNPFPQLREFVDKYDLDSCTHPFLPVTEEKQPDGTWKDTGTGRVVVPKAHSHMPAFTLLIKVLDMWKANHGGTPPQTSAEKDAFKVLFDDLQLSQIQDEENFVEAKTLARHAYAPFDVSSEVRSLFADDKAAPTSSCTSPFWLVVRGLRLFVDNEGGGRLPLSGNLPDMHADTKSYIALQNLYREQAQRDTAAVVAHVQKVLADMGQPPDLVAQDEIALMCRNAAHIRMVRTRSLSEEYSRPNSEEWGWMLDMPEEFPHHLYVLLRAAERYRVLFGAYPGSTQPMEDGDVDRYKEVVSQLCSEMGVQASSFGDDILHEVVRYGASELHSMAAAMGGVGAQEVTKVLMKQFIPANGTFVFNGVSGKNALCHF